VFENILTPLGVTAKNEFAYYVKSTKQVRLLKPADHTTMNLLAMATEADWLKAAGHLSSGTHTTRQARGTKQGRPSIHWSGLAAELMKLCREAGSYNPVRVRGRGIWFRKDGTPVVNTGRDLHVYRDGVITVLGLAEGSPDENDPYHYVSTTTPFAPPASNMLTEDQAIELQVLIDRFPYSDARAAGDLIFGWIACVPILSRLGFRPQLIITAERGAGKTTLVRMLRKVLGYNHLHFEGACSTEPGIRQTLGIDAVPIIIDEFETTNPTTKSVIDLLRVASNAEGLIAKGTSGGQPMHFAAVTMAVVAGIAVRMPDAASASRFAVIELEKRTHSEEEKTALDDALRNIPDDLGTRIACRMTSRWDVFEANRRMAATVLKSRGADDRQSDLYATLYAGKWTLLSDFLMPRNLAEEELAWFVPDSDENTDHKACVDHLLAHQVRPDGRNVGQLLVTVRTNRSPNVRAVEQRLLAELGVRYDPERDEVTVANGAPGILAVYARTSWADGQHAKVLRRMGGHNNDNRAVRFGPSHVGKATSVRWDQLYPDTHEGNAAA
jgi:putative DNA primase/helicase